MPAALKASYARLYALVALIAQDNANNKIAWGAVVEGVQICAGACVSVGIATDVHGKHHWTSGSGFGPDLSFQIYGGVEAGSPDYISTNSI
jgi:hypothetical protein